MRDVVIVGGGPAGSTTALALVTSAPELADRVVLLDRARFPREKPCAGALGMRGDALLHELGVHVDVPSAFVDGMSFRGAEASATAAPGRIGRVVRRIEFDHALVREVAARGVEVRDGVRVEAVREDGEGGAILETAAGPLGARVVVGCDGVGSIVRKTLGLGAGRLRAQVVEVDTEPVRGDPSPALLHFDASDRKLAGYAWDFPTVVDGRKLVCRGIYRLKVDHERDDDDGPDVATLLERRLRAQGIDPARCKNKRYAERGYEPASLVARGAVMLVGESSGIDPVTGEGIAQAIEYGVLAGRFLARRLARTEGRVVVDDWASAMSRSRLARDLRIRTRFVRLFYGPTRPEVERFLTESPDALFVGAQHFAAQAYDWLKVGEVVGKGAARLLGAKIREALG
ncbi:MAG TPA: NAD(P)/FAD-dependent oxidoreductase [Polyangiaceae bacterium]